MTQIINGTYKKDTPNEEILALTEEITALRNQLIDSRQQLADLANGGSN